MSYEVFDEYKGHPGYNEFKGKLHKIVNQMNELKSYYYSLIRKQGNQIESLTMMII
jgi:hypothetical protein